MTPQRLLLCLFPGIIFLCPLVTKAIAFPDDLERVSLQQITFYWADRGNCCLEMERESHSWESLPATCGTLIWGGKVPVPLAISRLAAGNLQDIPGTVASQKQNLWVSLHLLISEQGFDPSMASVLQSCKKGARAAGGHHKGGDKDTTARQGLLAPLENIAFAGLNSTTDSPKIFPSITGGARQF